MGDFFPYPHPMRKVAAAEYPAKYFDFAIDDLARRWLGAEFVDHYVVMKRAEVAAQAASVTDWEIARYLDAL